MRRIPLTTLCGFILLVSVGVGTGDTWYIQRVDSAGRVGWYISLALDASDYAHIGYMDYTNGDLKYASTRAPGEASHELPATGYYMISLPLTPALATPHDLLSDDLGDGNYYMWGWDGRGYQTIPTSPPACQTTTLSMQDGYWLLAQAATLGRRRHAGEWGPGDPAADGLEHGGGAVRSDAG